MGQKTMYCGSDAMNVSARNVFKGKISALTEGLVNVEVAVDLSGGDTLVAIATVQSLRGLGLQPGCEVMAWVKAPWIILISGGQAGTPGFSARNRLTGTVRQLIRGALNCEVTLSLAGGSLLHAVVSNEAVRDMGLQPGLPATAMIKASDVILGVRG